MKNRDNKKIENTGTNTNTNTKLCIKNANPTMEKRRLRPSRGRVREVAGIT